MSILETVCKTNFGKFRVKIDSKNIYVGGKTFCVNIVIHDDKTELYWLRTEEGGCELDDKVIRGENTIKIVSLAFSLLRKYFPERKEAVTLLDDSGFSWKDSRGKPYKTNFLKGYLLIHRKTWYEDKFGAVMVNPLIYKEYRKKADNNFNDASRKPARFNFINSEAKEKLEPLYDSSTTWGEFIDKFVDKYDDEKYKLMNEWYRQAIYSIFDGMEINQDWKIEIQNIPNIECNTQEGGKGKTRKNRRVTFSKYYRLEPFSWSPS